MNPPGRGQGVECVVKCKCDELRVVWSVRHIDVELVEKNRVYSTIVEQIVRLIESGQLKEGDQLPSQTDLARHFGVGRPAVREALCALELGGYVEMVHGRGTFVAKPQAESRSVLRNVLATEPSPFGILQARKVVESGIAGLAAEVAGEAGIQRARGVLERAAREGFRLESDREFHMAIAAATGNNLLADIAEALLRVMDLRLFKGMAEKNLRLLGRPERYLRQHEKILSEILARNPDGAQAAMVEHIEATARDLLGDDGECS